MRNGKRLFLEYEFFVLTISASLSTRDKNNPVYKIKSNPNKKRFKEYIKKKLDCYKLQYEEKVKGEDHIKNIQELADEITKKNKDILHKGRFRIGITQKLLNLYLKYLWTAGFILEPPHCPFDSIVIGKLSTNKIKYASFDTIKEYCTLVDLAQKEAKKVKKSIAQWELKEFKRRLNQN